MAETEAYGDRYRIIERIGDGGSSVVYRALDTRLGVEVALKVVHTDASREDTLRARLRTEAETMMRLSHPNILQVYAVGEDAGWIAMDLSEQGSLSDHVGEHGPLVARRRFVCDEEEDGEHGEDDQQHRRVFVHVLRRQLCPMA